MNAVPNRKVVMAALVALGAVALPLVVTQPSYQNFLILILMGAQLGVAWNILGGYAGQVSLGHAVFYGIGAYTSTVLSVKLGLSPWLGAPLGGLVAVAFSLAMGWPCFRLKGHYFAMATIAVAEVLCSLDRAVSSSAWAAEPRAASRAVRSWSSFASSASAWVCWSLASAEASRSTAIDRSRW